MKLTSKFLLFSFIFFPLSFALASQARHIRLSPAGKPAILKGLLAPDSSQVYTVGAKQGEQLRISLRFEAGQAKLDVADPGGFDLFNSTASQSPLGWKGGIKTSGPHILTVTNLGKPPLSYTLEIEKP